MSGPVLSVVIPCLNEAGILEPALQRLQFLRAAGHELILVDGGSLDRSPMLARPLVDKLAVTGPGRARQMNEGALMARGQILWFLHLDTTIAPGDERLVMQRGGGSTPGWGRFDLSLGSERPILRLVARLMNIRSRLTGIATGDQGIFVRQDVFHAVGGYPEIPLMEDVAICSRLKRIARPACLRRRLTTSSRRWERNGALKTILLMWSLRVAFACGADPARLAEFYRPCSSPTPES